MGLIATPSDGEGSGIAINVAFGFTMGALMWILLGASYGLAQPSTDDADSREPVRLWRQDVWASLTFAALAPLVWFLLRVAGAPPRYAIGYGFTIPIVVFAAFTPAWSAFMSQIQLALRHRTPVRLMRFLEDARSRQVLRTVGPVYQFRHAKLQDRLAALSKET